MRVKNSSGPPTKDIEAVCLQLTPSNAILSGTVIGLELNVDSFNGPPLRNLPKDCPLISRRSSNGCSPSLVGIGYVGCAVGIGVAVPSGVGANVGGGLNVDVGIGLGVGVGATTRCSTEHCAGRVKRYPFLPIIKFGIPFRLIVMEFATLFPRIPTNAPYRRVAASRLLGTSINISIPPSGKSDNVAMILPADGFH
jgi:hypothetical protein